MKNLQRSGRKKSDFLRIKMVIDTLAVPKVLPTQFRDHALKGNYSKYRECHVFPDLLIIYYQDKRAGELFLYRIGSHAKLLSE